MKGVFIKHTGQRQFTVVHIINKTLLRPNSDKNPYELWFGRPSSIHFKLFGSKCYIKNNDEHLGKYDVIIRGCTNWCYNFIIQASIMLGYLTERITSTTIKHKIQ